MILGCHNYLDIINKIIIYINLIGEDLQRKIYFFIRYFGGWSYWGSWGWFTNFFWGYSNWCFCDSYYF